jgi:anti-sigma factor RsiW
VVEPPVGGLRDHDAHDPELIAALLDRDLADAERAAARGWIATCASCASLHADLQALAVANRDLATPARPRDFTLTAADAMRARTAVGEPVAVGARLSVEMNDATSGHAGHDRLVIANLLDRSVDAQERARGEAQLAACRACALLRDDLAALSAATRALPVPSRPRSFTLTEADAERLRVRGWRRLLAAIGTSRDAFSRPLALGLTTLGLAGLLFATIPGAIPGGGTSSADLSTGGNAAEDASRGAGFNPETMLSQASGAPSAEAAGGPAAAAAPAPAPAASGPADGQPQEPDNLFVGGEQSPLAGEPDRDALDAYAKALTPGTAFGGAPMIVAGVLLLAGLGLFALRWFARRLGDG